MPAKPRDLLVAQYAIRGDRRRCARDHRRSVRLRRRLPRNAVGFLLVFLLMLSACMSIGGLIGGRAQTAKFATTIGTVLLFPLMFTAGAWVQVLGDAASGGWSDLKDFVVIAVWTAVLGTAATRFFRWE